jgi:hypothetical protein
MQSRPKNPLRTQVPTDLGHSAWCSISWSLKEEVRFRKGRTLDEGWADYPILTFGEVPDIQVELLDRPGTPFLGVGEASQNRPPQLYPTQSTMLTTAACRPCLLSNPGPSETRAHSPLAASEWRLFYLEEWEAADRRAITDFACRASMPIARRIAPMTALRSREDSERGHDARPRTGGSPSPLKLPCPSNAASRALLHILVTSTRMSFRSSTLRLPILSTLSSIHSGSTWRRRVRKPRLAENHENVMAGTGVSAS